MYEALVSFTGKITMAQGEVIEITDKAVAKDLIEAGYIKEVKAEKPVEIKKEEVKEEVKQEVKPVVNKKAIGKKKK